MFAQSFKSFFWRGSEISGVWQVMAKPGYMTASARIKLGSAMCSCRCRKSRSGLGGCL